MKQINYTGEIAYGNIRKHTKKEMFVLDEYINKVYILVLSASVNVQG